MDNDIKQKLTEAGYTGNFTLEALIEEAGEELASIERLRENGTFTGWKATSVTGDFAGGYTAAHAVAALIFKDAEESQ